MAARKKAKAAPKKKTEQPIGYHPSEPEKVLARAGVIVESRTECDGGAAAKEAEADAVDHAERGPFFMPALPKLSAILSRMASPRRAVRVRLGKETLSIPVTAEEFAELEVGGSFELRIVRRQTHAFTTIGGRWVEDTGGGPVVTVTGKRPLKPKARASARPV